MALAEAAPSPPEASSIKGAEVPCVASEASSPTRALGDENEPSSLSVVEEETFSAAALRPGTAEEAVLSVRGVLAALFSEESLLSDALLLRDLTPEGFLPLESLLQHPAVRATTDSASLLLEAVQSLPGLAVVGSAQQSPSAANGQSETLCGNVGESSSPSTTASSSAHLGGSSGCGAAGWFVSLRGLAEAPRNKIFVRNLPGDATDATIRELLKRAPGSCEEAVSAIRGEAQGAWSVSFVDAKTAKKAALWLRNQEVQVRKGRAASAEERERARRDLPSPSTGCVFRAGSCRFALRPQMQFSIFWRRRRGQGERQPAPLGILRLQRLFFMPLPL